MAKKLNITTTSNKPNIELVVKAMQRFIIDTQKTNENEEYGGNN